MVCVNGALRIKLSFSFDNIYKISSLPKYVLGYGIDRKKLNQLILEKAPDIDTSLVDNTADRVIGRLLDFIDNDQHWIVPGELNGDSFIVISFGQEVFGDGCEDLKQKKLRPPEYLDTWQSITCRPTVFELLSQ